MDSFRPKEREILCIYACTVHTIYFSKYDHKFLKIFSMVIYKKNLHFKKFLCLSASVITLIFSHPADNYNCKDFTKAWMVSFASIIIYSIFKS